MTMLFLLATLACSDSKKESELEKQENIEILESRTSGSIEIKAFVPEKTDNTESKDVLPKPDLDIDGNPITANTKNVVVTTLDGKFLTIVKKETDPKTGVETITVTITD